jgi:hypothetical protein
MEILKIITLIVQMGMPITFPAGEESLQKPLADEIKVICMDSVYTEPSFLHSVKNHPKFERTSKSLFTRENIKNLYIFLTHIDSTQLYIEDCDYSMLKFLRYKANQQKLGYKIIDSMTYHVNEELLRIVRWDKPVDFKMYENGTVFESTFDTYTEYWQCSEKHDYSPKYPYISPKRTALRKNYDDEQSEDLKYILSNPIMVFSIMPLDDFNYDLPYNLEGASKTAELETTGGRDIKGMGIDLDGDKVLDAFWYHQDLTDKIIEVATRLYINLEGRWTPIWYTYFREM